MFRNIDIKDYELTEKLREKSLLPLKDIPELLTEKGFGKAILPLFKYILKNCVELEEATSIKMFPHGLNLYYISFNTKKPLPSCYEKPEYTTFQPAYDYDLINYETHLDTIKSSKRSKHVIKQSSDYTTFLWESTKFVLLLLDKYEELFIESFPEIILKVNLLSKKAYKEKMIDLLEFFKINNNHHWQRSFMEKLSFKLNEADYDEIKDIQAGYKELNYHLQIENNTIKKQLEKANKPKKKDLLKEYKTNHNQESWDDVELIFFESSNNYSYKTLDGLKSLSLTGKRKELLHLILISDGIQLDMPYHHEKVTFNRLRQDLKEMFNKELEPVKWNKGSRVYKINFKFKIYQDSNEYKTKPLTQEIESKLQCNLEEFEN